MNALELANSELLEEIEQTRKSMVYKGLASGFTHPETIRLSQRLDILLNELHKVNHADVIIHFG